jgi:hypothetical protein
MLTWQGCNVELDQFQEGSGKQQSEVLRSVNYGTSCTSQMLAELILQFSVLHFCMQGEKKPKEKKRKNGCQSAAPGLPEVLCAIKANLRVIHGTVCASYVLAVLVGKNSQLPNSCFPKTEIFF